MGSHSQGCAAVRVDWLDGDEALKSKLFAEPCAGKAPFDAAVARWPSGTDADVEGLLEVAALHVDEDAPAAWSSADDGARRIRVSLMLSGDGNAVAAKLALSTGTCK